MRAGCPGLKGQWTGEGRCGSRMLPILLIFQRSEVMSDYAMLSMFFTFFLTMFILSVVMAVGELQKTPVKAQAKKKNTRLD
jgi:hypothetical protein